MVHIEPQSFNHLEGFDGLSERCMREHIKLYEGYVSKYNEMMGKMHDIRAAGQAQTDPDTQSLKVDITFALGAIKNHELFFDILGGNGGAPAGDLAKAIVKSFHNIEQYLADLRHAAIAGRGWVWTAYDLDYDYLFNYEAGARASLPVWNAVPILGIDMAGHAYFYDYGNNRVPYVDAVLKSINWERVAKRYAAAKKAGACIGRAG
jgi:Fe-Mn family superoxide dismutase